MTVDDMFFSTADAADDQARAKKRAKAESVLAQLRSASDPVSAFTSLADKNSEDPKREEHPSGITFAAGDGTLPQTVDDAAASLKENTLSDVVETKDGYYLLIRKPLDQKAAAASYFDHLLQTAADSATIQKTAAYSQINVADFYKKLTAARTASGDKSSSSASSG
jgi:parvulin-like peptidyl-prolyl isomerase